MTYLYFELNLGIWNHNSFVVRLYSVAYFFTVVAIKYAVLSISYDQFELYCTDDGEVVVYSPVYSRLFVLVLLVFLHINIMIRCTLEIP